MTETIGTAWIEVLGKTAQFGPQVKRDLTSGAANRAAAEAGDRFGTVVGKAIGGALRPFANRSADDFGRDFSRKAKDHGLSFGKLVGAGITAGLGIDSIQAVVGKAFDTLGDASDLAESQSKNVAVFKESAGVVEAFAKDSERNLLLTKQAAIEAGSTFGNLFVAMGEGRPEAANLSVQLIGLAEDLKSFSNVPVDEALQALQAGVLGEAEPLRRFGVALSEARVQSEAYAIGLVKPVKDADAVAAAQLKVAAATENLRKVQREHGVGTLAAAQAQEKLDAASKGMADAARGSLRPLTDLEKIQARISIILKDTANAQGDASRTIDGQANSYAHLKTQLGNISAELGGKLLPYTLDATHAVSDLITEFEAGTGTGGEIRDTLANVADVARDVGGVLNDTVVPAIGFFADHPDAFKAIAESMVIYAAATKTAAFYSALIKAPPVPGAGGGKGLPLPILGFNPATITAVAGGIAIYEANKIEHDNPRGFTGAALSDNPVYNTLFGKSPSKPRPKTASSTPPRSLYPMGPIAPYSVSELGSIGKQHQVTADKAAAAADALHATQVRMRDDAEKTAKAAQFAADQYAANQERQAKILEASQEAVQARFDATEQSLQRQSDAIERQIGVLESSREKILDFRRDVFSSTTSFTALTALASDPSRATAAGIVGSLQARVGAEKLFTKNIATLGQRGLDKGVLAELVAAGPENRGIASALAAATPSQISALNAAEKQSRAQAQALAATATSQQFGPQALANLQRGLATQNRLLASVDKRLAVLPKQLQQALKDDKTRVTRNQKTAVTK